MHPPCPLPFRLLPVILALFLPAAASAQGVVISEFLAHNRDGLTDDDGTHQDWIELRNNTAAPVNLLGWYLSDNAANKNKWPCPSVAIPAGGTLLIWASEKDRRDPTHPLHTNFKLSSSGEYLGLSKPNGAGGTVVEHEYVPAFPPQYQDISYGLAQTTTVTTLAGSGSATRYLVPANGNLDVNQGLNSSNWIGTTFNDTAWAAATLPLHYGRDTSDPYDALPGTDIEAPLYNVRTSIYTRTAFNIASLATIGTVRLRLQADDGYIAYLNGVPIPVADFNGPENEGATTLQWNSAAAAEYADSVSTAWQETVIAKSLLLTGSNILCVHGFNRATTNNDFLLWPELIVDSSTGTFTGGKAWFRIPTPNAVNVNGTTNPGPNISETTENPPPPSVAAPGAAIADSAAQFSGTQGQSGWYYGYAGFASGVPASSTYSSGLFTPFAGGSASGAWNAATNHWTGSAWDLNTASAAPWTFMTSTGVHPNDSTPGPLQSAVRRWVSTVTGNYLLTGSFNRPATGVDGTTGHLFLNGVSLFSALTIGDTKSFTLPVSLTVGDKIDMAVDVGPADADGSDSTNTLLRILPPPAAPAYLTITARVAPTVNALQSVVCKFRVMQLAESTLTMKDDGIAPDTAAGDGVFTCRADLALTNPGEMLRWRIVATDSTGAAAVDPPYADPLNSPQYFGTVVNDPATATSQLQIFHWFPVSAASAATSTGDRGSVFHLGEFYDNVRARVHGQSTVGFAKKSYGFDFAHNQRFRFKAGEKRVRDIVLLSNWADKAKTRNALAWESYRSAGMPALLSFPVRVQQNGAFYGVYDLTEDPDDLYLERAGLDANGALYKMYNQFNSTPGHANSGVEKKTRQEETNADLLALLNGLNPSTGVAASLPARRQFAYDNVDLFALANNLAVTALITNNDQGHKNYFLYRDSDGTRQWMLLPWDCDLTFGHTWTGNSFAANPPQLGAAYFDDHMDSQRGLQLGATNWLKQIAYNCPEFNRMYLRRLRTLMDQWLVSETAVTGYFETRMTEVISLLDPPSLAATQTDAWLDGQKWGVWWVALPWQSANVNTSATVAATAGNYATVWNRHGPRAALARIIDPAGNPGTGTLADATNGLANSAYLSTANYPGGTVTNTAAAPGPYSLTYPANTYPPFGSTTTVHPYLKGRRLALYNTSASRLTSDRDQSSTTVNDRDVIPSAQAGAVNVSITTEAALLDVNPGAQTQEAEFFTLRNNEATEVDLSGWSLTGAISYTFPGGCVVPPADGASTLPNAANLGLLHVAKNPWRFRQRTGAVTGGQNRLVTGPYSGQLSARGETLELRNAAGALVSSFTYGANPTPAQLSLRISELLYNPNAPSVAELAVNPALQRSSFEWMELANTGGLMLTLTGAQFTEGVSFTFPATTLAPGARLIVAADPAAFTLRWPGASVPVLGPWTGSLDDGGEQIHLVDAGGESILEFAYDGAWSWPADDAGHSLVMLDVNGTAYSDYDLEAKWGLSALPGGTPGAAHADVGTIYKQWRRAPGTGFSAAEQLDELVSGPGANPDGDSSSNALEYATGSGPLSAGGDAVVSAGTAVVAGETYATLTYRRRRFAPDLVCWPEAGDDLSAWSPMTEVVGAPVNNGDGTEWVTVRDGVPVSGLTRRLLRLRVEILHP